MNIIKQLLKDNERLFNEYNHTKNIGIDLNNLSVASNKNIWWKCKLGHEWLAKVNNRYYRSDKCPICSNKQVLIGYNNLFYTNPELKELWDYQNNSINPDNITSGSAKKAYWVCKNGHRWSAEIRRVASGNRCPQCNRHVPIKGENDFATEFPELLKEWDYKKNTITPDSILSGSDKLVWWICNNNHSYKMRINHKTGRNDKCPVCSNKKIISGVNDLFTTNPELMNIWNYEKNNSLNIFPNNYSYGSSKKVWWKCEFGHEWATAISYLSNNKTGCPECAKSIQTSLPEQVIFFYVSKYFPDSINSFKSTFLGKREIDIYIPSLKLGIEYDGLKWHKNLENDINKDTVLKQKGIELIRFREIGLSKISSSYNIMVNVVKNDIKFMEKPLEELFEFINKKVDYNLKYDINIERDYISILSLKNNYLNHDKNNTIDKYNPDLLKEWDYMKNTNIKPELITIGSRKKVYWICAKGHSYIMEVNKKTSRGFSCPICANRRVLSGFNDLNSKYPLIASEWDYNKNKVSTNSVYFASQKKYWWICSSCGFKFCTSVYNRSVRNYRCPNCKKV